MKRRKMDELMPHSQVIRQRYLEGASALKLAREYSCSPPTIYTLLKEIGVQMRPVGRGPQKKGTGYVFR